MGGRRLQAREGARVVFASKGPPKGAHVRPAHLDLVLVLVFCVAAHVGSHQFIIPPLCGISTTQLHVASSMARYVML